jgi:hypothetical protein
MAFFCGLVFNQIVLLAEGDVLGDGEGVGVDRASCGSVIFRIGSLILEIQSK